MRSVRRSWVHAGKEERAAQRCARYDASSGNKGGHSLSAAALLIVNKFGGRRDFRIGPDWPCAVVKIKLRQDVSEIDVSGPVGVDGSHVSPVGARIIAGPDAGVRELMGHRPAVFHDIGNDVLAEVVA